MEGTEDEASYVCDSCGEEIIPLEKTVDAHPHLESNQRVGKVVVTV
jgi:hypothetical protein